MNVGAPWQQSFGAVRKTAKQRADAGENLAALGRASVLRARKEKAAREADAERWIAEVRARKAPKP